MKRMLLSVVALALAAIFLGTPLSASERNPPPRLAAFQAQRAPNMSLIRKVEQVCCCTAYNSYNECCAVGAQHNLMERTDCNNPTTGGIRVCAASWCGGNNQENNQN